MQVGVLLSQDSVQILFSLLENINCLRLGEPLLAEKIVHLN